MIVKIGFIDYKIICNNFITYEQKKMVAIINENRSEN